MPKSTETLETMSTVENAHQKSDPQRTIEVCLGATFAAEAYLSEGPLHIVFGNQSGNLEAMQTKPEHF